MGASDSAFDGDDASGGCIQTTNRHGGNGKSWSGIRYKGGTVTYGRGGSYTQCPGPAPNPPLPGMMISTRTTLPSTVTSESILISPPTALRGGLPILASTSTSLDNSPTEGSNATLSSRVPLTKSSSSRFTTSVRFTTDPSGTTDITSIGILPSGTTSSATSTNPDSKAGLIAGVVISMSLVILIIGFLFYLRTRRKNRVAPSAQYLAEYGDRPLSRGFFFNRRSNQQYSDISHGQMNSIWQGIKVDHSDAPEKIQPFPGPATRTHMNGPEMQESQDHTNGSSLSISGKTSIGAAAGHSPAPDDPFADDFGAQMSTVTGH